MASSEEQLPAGYTSRAATIGDAPALAELSTRYDLALGLRPDNAGSFLRWIMQLPYVSLPDDSRLIEHDGAVAAFVLSTRDPASEGAAMDWFGIVDPDHHGRSLGSALVRWSHKRAHVRALEEGPFRVRTMCPAVDTDARALFALAGYAHVRTTWDMHRALTGGDAPGPVPEGITIRRFRSGRDERTFWEVAESAFAEHFGFAPAPYASWEGEWYDSDDWNPDRVLLAERDDAVVGELAWVDADPDGYITSLGVLKEHRGRGIAQALLVRAFADIAAAGFANASLSVDTENATGAVQLYRKVGMDTIRESHVFQRDPA